jgi:hypothetical protein
VGVVLAAGSAGVPELDTAASFAGSADPGPHVQPLATALAAARSRCFSSATAASGATARVHVHGGTIHATPTNDDGRCLAAALDGRAIDDPADFDVELAVRLSSR